MKPIDRAARTQVAQTTVGHVGGDAPRCHDCGQRRRQGTAVRAVAAKSREDGGRWRTRIYCPECIDSAPARRGEDAFLFAARIQSAPVGASVRPSLILAGPTVLGRSLAGTGTPASRDPGMEVARQ